MGKGDRLADIRAGLEGILEDDLHNVRLSKWMFHTEEEMKAAGLEPHEIARVRAWEVPRKEVAAGLAMSAARLEALAKEDKTGDVRLNIERAVIQIPAPDVERKRLSEAVIIDVEPGK